MKTILTLIIALFVMPASAKVFKCKVNGQTKYQQAPCSANDSGEITIKPNVMSTEGIRQQIAADEEERIRQQQIAEILATKAAQEKVDQATIDMAKNMKRMNKKINQMNRQSIISGQKMDNIHREIKGY
ncbi:MAG: hypothetical protein K9L22_06655 [Methylococcaceae bacterium]|nr:hypothetical protein [Methylococcaceae bacterium]